MRPRGFSSATALDELRAGARLQDVADAHPMDEIAGAVADALTGLRLGVSSLDDGGLRRVAGLEAWSVAEIVGHTLGVGEAAQAVAAALAAGRAVEDAVPYGRAGPAAATRAELLAAIDAAEARLASTRVLAAGGPTHPHPELGPLTARGWILFIGIHDAAHLHQAAAVVRAR